MYPFFAIPLVALFCFIQPTVSFGYYKRAVNESVSGNNSTSGEKAVILQYPLQNPLTDLGAPSKWIGVNTEYLTDLVVNGQTTTKWIGVNTEYLTMEVVPEMNPATPTATLSVITTSVGAVASTATASDNGLNPGDVSVTFSPALVAKLKSLAVEVCGSGAKNRMTKRAESCAYEFANRVSAPGGPMEFDIALPTISASDVAAILSAIGKTQVPTAGAVGVALIMWYIWAETGDMPNTVDIPKEDIGTPNSPSAPAPSAPAITTGSACPTGSNSPVCQDSVRCNSPNSATCTTSVKYETCPCLNYVNMEVHPATPSNLLAVQSNLVSMSSIVDGYVAPMTTSMAAPNCMADGAPWFLPTSWCDCGVSATYPTIPPSSGVTASSANCAYTVLPTATINPTSNTNVAAPTNVPGQNGVSGCAYYIAADQGLPSGTPNYCFCGGGPNAPAADAPLLTHTDVNPPVTDCHYTTQPPTGWSPTTKPSPPVSSAPPPPPPAPTVGSIVCNPTSYADGCSWSDVHSNWVDSLADYMGQQFSTSVFTSNTGNFTRIMRDGGASGKGVVYLMSVGWIPGCTSQTSEKMDRPLDPNKEFDWQGLLKNNYYDCTGNNGLGGYTDVGCLRYGFFPNKVGGVFPSSGTPQYSNFWDKMHYC